MRLAALILSSPLWLGFGVPAQAASIVMLLNGDDQDRILTVTGEDGTADTAITLICEAPRLEFGVGIKGLPAGGRGRIRVRADGANVSLGSPGVREPQTIFFLKGPSGRAAIVRLAQARLVEVDMGAGALRFRPQDGAATVAQFRSQCGI